MRILVVEDETLIRRDMVNALSASGYVVEEAANGEEAWYKGDVEAYDAAILDLGLPDLDGLTVLKRWRANNRTLPVIVVSARGTWRERVEGIDAGADDYLPKPFEMEELLSRLHAVLRRSSGGASMSVEIGPVVIDSRHSRLTVSGVPVALSALEFRLIAYLGMRRGRPVSQIELTEHLYAQDFERDSNAIEVLVGRLRRKLKVDLIKTQRGFGYMLNEDIATAGRTEQAS
jgi:two-component system, OmpR family, response regulator